MMLTIEQVMERTGSGRRTVRWWISSGELKAVNLSADKASERPRLRIRTEDLETFLDARSVGRTSTQQATRARRYKPQKKYV
jgi:excisionase family DNA binding protein